VIKYELWIIIKHVPPLGDRGIFPMIPERAKIFIKRHLRGISLINLSVSVPLWRLIWEKYSCLVYAVIETLQSDDYIHLKTNGKS
jgi:hypothetical protein